METSEPEEKEGGEAEATEEAAQETAVEAEATEEAEVEAAVEVSEPEVPYGVRAPGTKVIAHTIHKHARSYTQHAHTLARPLEFCSAPSADCVRLGPLSDISGQRGEGLFLLLTLGVYVLHLRLEEPLRYLPPAAPCQWTSRGGQSSTPV